MTLAIKPGVQPQLVNIIAAAGNVATLLGITLRVTSGLDGSHGPASLHYALRAADFGTKEFTAEVKAQIVREFQRELGGDYDVLLEFVGQPKEHLHVEFDP